MSPRFVLGRENVPCVAEVVNRSLKADCTDFISQTSAVPAILSIIYSLNKYFKFLSDKLPFKSTSTGVSKFNHFSIRGL